MWELLDACVNGIRLLSTAENRRSEAADAEPATLGGWGPRCRWYDARCEGRYPLSTVPVRRHGKQGEH